VRILNPQNQLLSVYNLSTYDLAYPTNRATLKALFLDAARPVDSDHDGLPDDWEMIYFGNLSSTANQDNDGDEVENLAEFALGTNPTNALSRPTVQMDYTWVGSQFRPRIVYRRHSGAAFQYRVEGSASLSSWITATGLAAPIVTQHYDGSGTATVSTPLKLPLTWPDLGFFRVRASAQ
jgi:hypothetical protein